MTGWTDREVGKSAWREAGAGDALVFLHGLGGTRSSWNPQLAHFAKRHRCLAWDMPGYGTAAPETPLTYGSIADRMVQFLDDAQVEKADLVGLSFGGMHALHTALMHPERIRSMALSSTSPAFGMDGTDPDAWRASRLDAIDAGATPAGIAEDVLDSIVGRPLDARVRTDLISAFARIPVDGFRAAVQCLPTNDLRARLGSISHRCLVLVGDLDTETPVAYAETLASGLVNAELVVLEGVGHLAPSEDPTRFNRVVADFLDEDQRSTS